METGTKSHFHYLWLTVLYISLKTYFRQFLFFDHFRIVQILYLVEI